MISKEALEVRPSFFDEIRKNGRLLVVAREIQTPIKTVYEQDYRVSRVPIPAGYEPALVLRVKPVAPR